MGQSWGFRSHSHARNGLKFGVFVYYDTHQSQSVAALPPTHTPPPSHPTHPTPHPQLGSVHTHIENNKSPRPVFSKTVQSISTGHGFIVGAFINRTCVSKPKKSFIPSLPPALRSPNMMLPILIHFLPTGMCSKCRYSWLTNVEYGKPLENLLSFINLFTRLN